MTPMTEQQSRTLDEALSIRWAGRVKRWHTLPILGPEQSDGEHSYHALSLLLLLHPSPSKYLIQAVLWHDTAERWAGDVPAPVRRENPALAKAYQEAEAAFMMREHPTVAAALSLLTNDDLSWLTAVDVLELIMFCDDQVSLGNTHAKIVAERGVGYLRNHERTPRAVLEFLDDYVNFGRERSFA